MTLFNTLKVICFTSLILILMSACSAATPMANSSLSTPIKPTSTATPTSTHSPTPTPTTLPSSTPTPKPSPTWTPTPLPTATPYIQPARSDLLPPITRDLVYLEHGQLKLWHHTNRQIMPLLESTESLTNITEFVISADSQNIIFSRVMTKPNQQIGQLNLETLQIKWLLDSAEPIMAWAISPDNQTLAYVIEGSQPSAGLIARQLVPTPLPNEFGDNDAKLTPEGVLYSRNIVTMQSVEVGFVSNLHSASAGYSWSFDHLIWSPDSHSILWSDGAGVWSSALALLKPKLLLSNQLAKPNDEGIGVYLLGVWSPTGQYLMMRTGYYEGTSNTIFDPLTGFMVNIPDSYQYVGSGLQLTWMSNNNLFALQPGDTAYKNRLPMVIKPMTGEIRHIETLSQSLAITRTESFSIAAQPAPENDSTSLTQFADGRLGFILTNEDTKNDSERGLYIVDLDTLRPHKVNSLPLIYSLSAIWNPDGSGAIIVNLYPENQPILYVPTDGSTLYDLSHIISPQACCFTWLRK